jgi:hypothetical protein
MMRKENGPHHEECRPLSLRRDEYRRSRYWSLPSVKSVDAGAR